MCEHVTAYAPRLIVGPSRDRGFADVHGGVAGEHGGRDHLGLATDDGEEVLGPAVIDVGHVEEPVMADGLQPGQ